jgi:hypothetical protein
MKQKIGIALVFILIVTGSVFYLSDNVFGVFGECLCSPEGLYTSYLCKQGSSVDRLIVDVSYCKNGICYFEVTVFCGDPNGSIHQQLYFKNQVRLQVYDLDCCDQYIYEM